MERIASKAAARTAAALLLAAWAVAICAVPGAVSAFSGAAGMRERGMAELLASGLHGFPGTIDLEPVRAAAERSIPVLAQSAPESEPPPVLLASDEETPFETDLIARDAAAKMAARSTRDPMRANARARGSKVKSKPRAAPAQFQSWPCIGGGICAWQDAVD